MNMPAVSVIIPVYGVEPFIARCARSLFGQTFRDLEFIFIDDCTPDKSMEILRQVLEEEFPDRIPQVKVFRMPQNSGQAKVRMQGLSKATGEYVIHCDSDDEVDTDAYRIMYEKAILEDLDIVSCDYYRVLPDSDPKYCFQFSKQGEELSDVLINRVLGVLWCRLMKRSLLRDIVPPKGNYCEDVVITCQAICRSKRFGHIPSALYYYYVRESSITSNIHLDRVRSGALENAHLVTRILEDQYHFLETDPAIVYYKYQKRDYLVPYIHFPGYYKKWCNIFPEIDSYYLFTPKISLESKFWFVLIHLRLYHLVKSITGFLFRRDRLS